MNLEELIEQVHLEVNVDRLRRGAMLWDWQNQREAPMGTELCTPCKDAGFSIIAHYKAIPKGMSHDGMEHPAMCWDHKKGNVPRHIIERDAGKEPSPRKTINLADERVESQPVLRAHSVDDKLRQAEKVAQLRARMPAREPLPEPIEIPAVIAEPLEEQMPQYGVKQCMCGCGTEFKPTGPRSAYAPGHKPIVSRKKPVHLKHQVPKESRLSVRVATVEKIAVPANSTLEALAKVKADLLAKVAAIEAVEKMLAAGEVGFR